MLRKASVWPVLTELCSFRWLLDEILPMDNFAIAENGVRVGFVAGLPDGAQRRE